MQRTVQHFARRSCLTTTSLPKNLRLSFVAPSSSSRPCQFFSSKIAARNSELVSKDGVVGTPIDFDINSKVDGNESQIVTVALEPGQVLRAESGAMMYMTEGKKKKKEFCVK